ncbi:hypothetical protein LSAT2_006780 [Lamellibrachia satsuma]|nr:hypothetical protein LSAT2_006780 [Lamellibrachia satsuma]
MSSTSTAAHPVIIGMKVAVFLGATCIFVLVMPQTYAEEEDESAAAAVIPRMKFFVYFAAICIFALVIMPQTCDGVALCSVTCPYASCKKICIRGCKAYCGNGVFGVCRCLD